MSDWGIISIQGRPYYTVARRISDFRAGHAISDGWQITTAIEAQTDNTVTMSARIIDPSGRVVATGHAHEDRSKLEGFMADSLLEVAETSAVGRALAFAGLGGNQSEIASADEVRRRGTLDAEEMSATKTRETIEKLVRCAEADDFAGCLEIWEELSQGQMIWINTQMDRFNKKRVGDCIAQARKNRDGAEPLSEKDQRRQDVRDGK